MEARDTLLLYCRSCRNQGVEKHFKGKSLPPKKCNRNDHRISCGGLTSHLTRGQYHNICQQYYINEGLLIKDNKCDFFMSIFIGRFEKRKDFHTSSQMGTTTTNKVHNHTIYDTTTILNNQVMHTFFHLAFDQTAVEQHMSRQRNEATLEMESQLSCEGNDEYDSSDEVDTANEFQTSDEEGESQVTLSTDLNHGVVDYNIIGRQEKPDAVFDREKKNYQQVS